jgi:hypothetical protein
LSLMGQCIDLIAEMGRASVNELMPHLPGRERVRVCQALSNARKKGHIRVVEKGKKLGFGGGSAPSYFELAGPRTIHLRNLPVCCVWEMGQRAQEGRRFWIKRVPRNDFATQEAA